MITIPPEIQECFHQFLYKESVPVNKHHYYKKWFNYYWDFCHKYLHPIAEKESLFYFIEKLREKKQKDFQIQQASHAVSIYYKIVNDYFGNASENIKMQPPIENKIFNIQENQQADNRNKAEKHLQPLKNKINKSTYEIIKDLEKEFYAAENKIDKSINKPARDLEKEFHNKEKVITCETVKDNSAKAVEVKSKPLEYGTNWRPAYNALKAEIKLRHYSSKTFRSYNAYVGKFQTFTKSKSLELLNDEDIKAFLTHLAVEKNVSASTQNLAFNSLLFFFRHVLKKEPGNLRDTVRAKRKPYIKVVLSMEEVDAVLQYLLLELP
ncbi:Integrase superfamily protein [Desulfonema limicola]|uniref:Integrase superfamily protein n=1 Tax=Desulfonema limicola TaxID=45656 RepID=A0A975BAV8_9BACT|nr:site-specific integrase [Desulfonema limicola]QTA82043.1 Integrase superfamily protein [Desulfonema limicola]